ncbi:MAG TPA: Rid family detoxifying hydrolase [Solirubrobacterales bacterium]|nr:Rid family detoxifying hydrolase [Solirubrobacterales bacterium]
MSPRVNIETDKAPAAIGPYSQAIAHDGVLYCSGAIPLDSAGELVGGDDAAEQARQCLRNLDAVAAAGGGELAEALQVTIYTTRLDEFPKINEAYAEFFDDPPPARVTIGVAALPKDVLIEIAALVPLK